MADEIRQYTVSVPAGTAANAPAVFPMNFPPREVQGLQIIVPVGTSGVVGFAVQVGGVTVIPYLSDQWVVTTGEVIDWPLESYPDSGSWSVQAYNTGTFPHSLSFRWLLKYIPLPGSAPNTAILDLSSINALAPSDTALVNTGEQP